MHVFLGPCVIRYPFLFLCFLLKNAVVLGSEGAVRECCEPMSPTPSFSTTEFPLDYYPSTEAIPPGTSTTLICRLGRKHILSLTRYSRQQFDTVGRLQVKKF